MTSPHRLSHRTLLVVAQAARAVRGRPFLAPRILPGVSLEVLPLQVRLVPEAPAPVAPTSSRLRLLGRVLPVLLDRRLLLEGPQGDRPRASLQDQVYLALVEEGARENKTPPKIDSLAETSLSKPTPSGG